MQPGQPADGVTGLREGDQCRRPQPFADIPRGIRQNAAFRLRHMGERRDGDGFVFDGQDDPRHGRDGQRRILADGRPTGQHD
ncbi:MAG: hypothetical protein J0H70_14780, partial [Microbacterium chocolatum]|nr:hypothetical protein [Microbacterium chocolatum]